MRAYGQRPTDGWLATTVYRRTRLSTTAHGTIAHIARDDCPPTRFYSGRAPSFFAGCLGLPCVSPECTCRPVDTAVPIRIRRHGAPRRRGRRRTPPHAMVTVGVDEAGTGSLIGGFAAAAAILPRGTVAGLRDSKRLSAGRREKLFDAIRRECAFGIGWVSREEVDSLGMARCRVEAFVRALEDLRKAHARACACVTEGVIDGTVGIGADDWHGACVHLIPGADATHPAVSAASIVAKVTRDRRVLALCKAHPSEALRYKWPTNKGYATPQHKQALAAFGRSEHHRASFRMPWADGAGDPVPAGAVVDLDAIFVVRRGAGASGVGS